MSPSSDYSIRAFLSSALQECSLLHAFQSGSMDWLVRNAILSISYQPAVMPTCAIVTQIISNVHLTFIVRGDPHIVIVGDPGMGTCQVKMCCLAITLIVFFQMLQAAGNIAFRCGNTH